MQTAHAVPDGKLSDDDLGVITRRLMETVRRINQGTLKKHDVLKALQMIVEGEARNMITPCTRRHLPEYRPFSPPPKEERQRSKAPVALRLPESLKRLGLYDKLREQYPNHTHYPDKHPEDIMAEMWEVRNIPQEWLNEGGTPVDSILWQCDAPERDRAIVASTLQWLGTPCGSEFLRQYLEATKLF